MLGGRNQKNRMNREKKSIQQKTTLPNSGENKMGVMPVPKLVISMSLPMMISMLVQAGYNVVDSIFVAMINEDALTAVSLAFPIQILMVALGSGMGVGVNALLSRSLGGKHYDVANKAAVNGVFLSWLSYLVFLVFGLVGVGAFYWSQTGPENYAIYEYGKQYLTIVCCFSIGIYTQFICERLLQSTGKTTLSMLSQCTGAVINLILDPILIFGLLGFPKLGVRGAAIATVIGQIAAGILGIWLNTKKNSEIKLSFQGFRPDWKIIGRIYQVGFPAIVMQAIGGVMNYGMNLILIGFTSTAAAVFGAYYKIQSIVFMPVIGLNNGIIPIIAYNYGAGKRRRVYGTIKMAMVIAECLLLVGFALFQLCPTQMLSIFSASESMLAIGVPALRIISLHFLIAGICISCGGVFQGLGNGVYSMYVSLARQLIVLLPAAWILSRIGGLGMLWWAFPIAEVMSFTVTAVCMHRINQKIIRKIPDNP